MTSQQKILKYLRDQLKAHNKSKKLDFVSDEDFEFHDGYKACLNTAIEWIELYGNDK